MLCSSISSSSLGLLVKQTAMGSRGWRARRGHRRQHRVAIDRRRIQQIQGRESRFCYTTTASASSLLYSTSVRSRGR